MMLALPHIATPIIAVTGKAYSGKNTVCGIIAKRYHVKQVAFADQMKHLIKSVIDVTDIELWGGSEKRGGKLRSLLQHVGTDSFRAYDEYVWAKALIKRLGSWETNWQDPYANPYLFCRALPPSKTEAILVTDLRFRTELEVLKTFTDATIIRVVRDAQNPNMTQKHRAHQSEIDLDGVPNSKFSAVIENNGSVSELQETALRTVDSLMRKYRKVPDASTNAICRF